MKLTLQIKLLPTCKQVEMLKDTFSVFNKACNAISQIAWERRVFKQFGLHKEVYYPIKERIAFPLSLSYALSARSQMRISLIERNKDVSVNLGLLHTIVVFSPTIFQNPYAPSRLLEGVRK